MKKNEYKKISENCGIAYIQEWNKDPEEYWYVVYVRTSKDFDTTLGEVFGKGKSLEEALIEAIKNLADCGLRGISFDYLENFQLTDLIECFQNKNGYIAELPYNVMPLKSTCVDSVSPESIEGNPELEQKYGFFESNTHVILHEDKAYPFCT